MKLHCTSKLKPWLFAMAIIGGGLDTKSQSTPQSFAYVLQADAFARTKTTAVAQLRDCERDWIILDTQFDNTSVWQSADLEQIRHGKTNRKVIAYISIGEAEDYRPYWHTEWGHHGKLSTNAPVWLGGENPDWKGNYRVKYWHPAWQQLILKEVAGTINQGFDGVYLDIVDGFETFEQEGRNYIDNRINPETRQSYRRDMVDWVGRIGTCARAHNPAALVIPQNGAQLLDQTGFAEGINAIGIEDLFTNGNRIQFKSQIEEVLPHLKCLAGTQKPVLLIEYPKNKDRQQLVMQKAHVQNFTWLITGRELKTMGQSGH